MAALLFLALGALAKCPFKHMNEEVELHAEKIKGTPPTSGTTTVHNCKCKQACGPTIEDGFNCDWCYTEGSCGHYSYTRLAYYDYCVYPSQPDYESHTWDWKHNYLWSYITKDQTHGAYANKLNVVDESVQTTFDTHWDWMPAGREKVIHAVGAVCQIDLKITSNKYTGILEQGTQTGYFRFGSAVDPVSEGINPGAGFKFLRTGVESANWVMLDDPNFTNVNDFNLWNRNLTNHVSYFKGIQQAVAVKFGQVSNCVTMVGLSNLAVYSQNGTAVAVPVFPWELTMVPAGNVVMPSAKQSIDEFMGNLIKSAPKGTEIYKVKAMDGPHSAWETIGTMTVKEDCVTSKYGDDNLFFRHQRIEEDWSMRTDWFNSAQDMITKACGYKQTTLTPPYKCTKETGSFEERCAVE